MIIFSGGGFKLKVPRTLPLGIIYNLEGEPTVLRPLVLRDTNWISKIFTLKKLVNGLVRLIFLNHDFI